ncbi:MAG: spore germination protein GerW family protein [Lachnospiraceae bacterium]|nr:spore germination protein GerW family protein [Lachnospiraceae bacterium]
MASEFDSLFKGVDTLLKTKTIIGDPITIDDSVIIPIMEVSFGMASGSFAHESSNAGAMSARMTPVALYVMQNGIGRVVNLKNTDAVSKVVDLIPDFVNKVSGKKVSPGIISKAKKMMHEKEE